MQSLDLRRLAALHGAAVLALLAGCASGPHGGGNIPYPPGRDGPEAHPPAHLDEVPDAVPKVEPIRQGGPNKPYEVLGQRYVPLTGDEPFTERGLASWYGKKFQGHATASGEIYNMYAMTAAHPTLPIPSYVRVRNPANGREVIVRVNDRGPFHSKRIIDLSYTAALKLDLLKGVAPVEIERITYDEIRAGTWRHGSPEPGATMLAQGPADAPARADPAAARMARSAASHQDAAAAPVAQAVLSGSGGIAGATAVPVGTAAGAIIERTSATLPAPDTAAPSTAKQGTAEADAADADAADDSVTASARETRPAPDGPPARTAPAAPPRVTASAASASAVPSTGAPSAPANAAAPIETASQPVRAYTQAARGFWVQLGAFRDAGGAVDFERRVQADLDWLAPLLAIFNDHHLHRLQAGPYQTRSDALSAAERIRSALQLVPVIVERR